MPTSSWKIVSSLSDFKQEVRQNNAERIIINGNQTLFIVNFWCKINQKSANKLPFACIFSKIFIKWAFFKLCLEFTPNVWQCLGSCHIHSNTPHPNGHGVQKNYYDGVVKLTKKKKDDMNHSLRPPENNLVNVGVNQCNDTKYCHNNSYRQHHCCFKI